MRSRPTSIGNLVNAIIEELLVMVCVGSGM